MKESREADKPIFSVIFQEREIIASSFKLNGDFENRKKAGVKELPLPETKREWEERLIKRSEFLSFHPLEALFQKSIFVFGGNFSWSILDDILRHLDR